MYNIVCGRRYILMGVRLWDFWLELFEIWHPSGQHNYRCMCVFSKRYDDFNYQTRRFEMSWYFTIIRLLVYMYGPLSVACQSVVRSSIDSWGEWWRHEIETFPALLSSMKGIHRSPVDSLHKGTAMQNFDISLIIPNKLKHTRVGGDLGRPDIHVTSLRLVSEAEI